MRATTYAEYGPPEVLQLSDVEQPVPGDHEVLIRVRAAEATKADCEMRSFRFPVKWFWLPLRVALGLLRALRELAEAGRITSIVDRVLPMERPAEAHRLAESGERRGAIVLAIDGDVRAGRCRARP